MTTRLVGPLPREFWRAHMHEVLDGRYGPDVDVDAMIEEMLDLAESEGRRLRKIHEANGWRDRYTGVLTRHKVLTVLHQQDGDRVVHAFAYERLAEMLDHDSPSRLGQVVGMMERDGLVTLHTDGPRARGKRITEIRLTAAGLARLDALTDE